MEQKNCYEILLLSEDPGFGQVTTAQQCTGNVGCTTTVVSPSTNRCPVGYVLDNYTCVRTQVVSKTSEKIRKCNPGYHLYNDQCVRYSSPTTERPLTYRCPIGYMLNGRILLIKRVTDSKLTL